MEKENQDPSLVSSEGKRYNFKFKPLSSQFMSAGSPKKAVASSSSDRKPDDGVPNNVGSRGPIGKGCLESESSDDEDRIESVRVRKLLEAERLKRNPKFDPFDPKYYTVRYTKSGKPIKKATKPYSVIAANCYGYLRYQEQPQKKKKNRVDNVVNNGDDSSDDEGLGLRTIAFPSLVKKLKSEIADNLKKEGKFSKSVDEAFREKYYIEIPYCRWCDERPCACFV